MTPISSIDEQFLADLVANQRAEGLQLEFKQELNFSKDGKDEFLKDLSAMANASGGLILYGISEDDGCAGELVGLDIENDDAYLLRINGMIQDRDRKSVV